jgi:hypothetical protein
MASGSVNDVIAISHFTTETKEQKVYSNSVCRSLINSVKLSKKKQ